MRIDATPIWSDRPEDIDAGACQLLWSAVLLQEWELSFGRGVNLLKGRHERRAVAHWFGSRGFFEVCYLAGVDGSAVLARWRALQGGCASAAPRLQAARLR